MPKPKDPRGDLGKWAEAQVNMWLETRSAKDSTFAHHRYPDSRAARGALAAQPADFLVAWKGHGDFHVEVKETAQTRRLPKGKVGQYGKLLKFYLAGIEPVLPVYMSETDRWVCLRSIDLFAFEECPASFPIFDLKVYPTHRELLEEVFT